MNDTKESLILKRLYLALAELLTEHHEFLSVEANQQQDFISLSPRAHKDDAAKLVGQGGETFHAMRIICSVAAARLGVRFHLARIKDDNRTSKSDDLTPPRLRRDWPQDEIFIAAQLVAAAMFGPEAKIEWNHQGREKSVLELDGLALDHVPFPTEAVNESLNRVFRSIGNAQGRVLSVALNPNTKGNLNESYPSRGRAHDISSRR